MISSIFGKTKPINFIIILGFLFFFYWFVHLFMFQKGYDPEQLLLQTFVLGILLFSLFVVNFIVKRNQITGTNSFCILYYTLLIVVFPDVLIDNNAILSSFFLLLSLRRLISLKSLKNIKPKIFDATLWIVVSSFFYDWAILFLVLVFVAIYFYEPKNIKNWLVPILAIFTCAIILVGVLILTNDLSKLAEHYSFSISSAPHYFLSLANSSKILSYSAIVIIAGFIGFLKLGKLGLGKIITMRLIAICLIIGLAVTFLKSSDGAYPILLTFFPSAILLTKYVEVTKKIKIKEIVLIASVLAPFILLLAGMIIK